MNTVQGESAVPQAERGYPGVEQFFASIYKWMVVGVLLSGLMAWLTYNSGLSIIYSNPIYFYGLVAIELGILFGVQWGIGKLSASTAFILYLVYAAVNGMTLAGFLFYYITTDPTLVVIIFGVAASMFAVLAVLGYNTKYNMSGWGTFLFAGMWGVFFSSLANIYFQNGIFATVISAVALVVFAGLTVYDNQYYKHLFASLHDEETQSKAATIGALHMYINFIMIFQSLLSLVGSRD